MYSACCESMLNNIHNHILVSYVVTTVVTAKLHRDCKFYYIISQDMVKDGTYLIKVLLCSTN